MDFDRELVRQRSEELLQEAQTQRLKKRLRANRARGSGLWRVFSWGLQRFSGLLRKLFGRV